jgi:hypothetical protein
MLSQEFTNDRLAALVSCSVHARRSGQLTGTVACISLCLSITGEFFREYSNVCVEPGEHTTSFCNLDGVDFDLFDT